VLILELDLKLSTAARANDTWIALKPLERLLEAVARPPEIGRILQATYCTAMVAELLVTVPSADLTINETLLPVGADCGTVMLIWTTPGNPGA
jgi:hypothetical protein